MVVEPLVSQHLALQTVVLFSKAPSVFSFEHQYGLLLARTRHEFVVCAVSELFEDRRHAFLLNRGLVVYLPEAVTQAREVLLVRHIIFIGYLLNWLEAV